MSPTAESDGKKSYLDGINVYGGSSTTARIKTAEEIQAFLDARVQCPRCNRKVVKLFQPSGICRSCLHKEHLASRAERAARVFRL